MRGGEHESANPVATLVNVGFDDAKQVRHIRSGDPELDCRYASCPRPSEAAPGGHQHRFEVCWPVYSAEAEVREATLALAQ